jgi:hypothetical protein
VLLRAAAIWFVLLAAAVTNGAVRVVWIIPRTGESAGHVISTLLLCAAIAALSWVTIRWIGPDARAAALIVGLLWLVLTLAFEFGAGHYLFGTPWPALLADYDVRRGRIWPLVLVVTFLAPLLTAWARGLVTR